MSAALPRDLPTAPTEPHWRVLHVSGQLNAHEAPQLRQQFLDALAEGSTHLILDMSSVEFIDSTGLGVLVAGLKRARSVGGELRLGAPSRTVVKVLRITGLSTIFEIVEQPGASAA